MKKSQFIMKNVAERDKMNLSSNENAKIFRLKFLVTSFIMSLTKKEISHINIGKVVTSNTEFNSEVIT
jgi:hypothetical protein